MERFTNGSNALVAERVSPRWADTQIAIAGFLAGYSGSTRVGHATELRLWTTWCRDHGLDILDARRPHLEMYARELEEVLMRKRSTVAHKLSVIAGFYKWCALEGVLERDPVAHVRRPKVEYITNRQYLDRMEMSRFLQYATMGSTRDAALCLLLGLNGLRISEALNADVEDMRYDRNHRLLHIVGKGRKEADVPLAPPTYRAIIAYLDGRTTGPVFLGAEGARMNRHAAARIIRRVGKAAGIDKHLSPHSMRHAFITAALDAGVPLRDVQHAARHADPRTTSYYDHGRKSFDSHATYIVSAFVAGG
jgi:integrase/recombinase XerD